MARSSASARSAKDRRRTIARENAGVSVSSATRSVSSATRSSAARASSTAAARRASTMNAPGGVASARTSTHDSHSHANPCGAASRSRLSVAWRVPASGSVRYRHSLVRGDGSGRARRGANPKRPRRAKETGVSRCRRGLFLVSRAGGDDFEGDVRVGVARVVEPRGGEEERGGDDVVLRAHLAPRVQKPSTRTYVPRERVPRRVGARFGVGVGKRSRGRASGTNREGVGANRQRRRRDVARVHRFAGDDA